MILLNFVETRNNMLYHRLKQFREYNKLETSAVAEALNISKEEYSLYESGKSVPDINIIEKLTRLYKVTSDEFYGYTPRLQIYAPDSEDAADDYVDEKILKMSDLSWDERQLILHYRLLDDKDDILSQIIKKNFDT